MCSQCIRSRDASSCCARRHCRNPQCSGPSQAAIPPMQCMLVTCLAAVPPLTLQSLRTGGPVAKTMHACAKLGGSAAARNAVMSNRLQCSPCNACYCQAWRQFSHRQCNHPKQAAMSPMRGLRVRCERQCGRCPCMLHSRLTTSFALASPSSSHRNAVRDEGVQLQAGGVARHDRVLHREHRPLDGRILDLKPASAPALTFGI